MKNERVAQMVTIAVLAVTLVLAIGRKGGWRLPSFRAAAQTEETGPQDAVYAMLDAARLGNIQAYLASFGGAQEARLRQSMSDSSPSRFGKYLEEMNSTVKGIAVTAPETVAPNQVRVRVEYVYQDRSEAQTMLMERRGAAWKIVDVSSSERVRVIVPYGTPVEDQ